MTFPRLPKAANSIQKGTPLKLLLGAEAIECLAHNISLAHKEFDGPSLKKEALEGLESLGLLERGQRLASLLRHHLPGRYSEAIGVLLASLTPPLTRTEGNGLEVLFYIPHISFVAQYGLDPEGNGGQDPFEVSMSAQYQLTKRFSAEFSIRPFLIHEQARALSKLTGWTADPDPHVRRLCSEGTRPRLPWAARIPAFIENPKPVLPLLEALKDDPSPYVRRSVANHLGDIAKDNAELAFEVCDRWLAGASNERRGLIRHALRYPAKKGDRVALRLRSAAKAQ